MAEQDRWHGGMRTARSRAALAAVVTGALAGVALPAGPALAATAGVPAQAVSFTAVGEHAFTVPLGVTSVHVVAVGGRGGDGYSPGGLGARVEADVRVRPGSTVYAEVGGNGSPASLAKYQSAAGGANGGEAGGAWVGGWLAQQMGAPPVSGAGGGGASDLQACPVASCELVNVGAGALMLVAGGGGGAGGESRGGNGGTPAGGNAGVPWRYAPAGIGRGADPAGSGNDENAIARAFPCPGAGGDSFGGGGGGGGYYCGGGGASWAYGGGGGGGSSYGPAGTAYSLTTQDPSVTITYQAAFRLAPASRSSLTLDGAGGPVSQQVPNGAASQLWQPVPQGSLYQIANMATGQCLTTSGTPGAQLYLGTCLPEPQNLWQLPPDLGASASGTLIWSPAYNLFIDVSGASITAGAAIDAQPYNGSAGQYFLTFPG